MARYYRAASLTTLVEQVNRLWPNRDKTSDGWIGDPSHQARKSDHNPDYDWPWNGVVRAQDIDKDGIDVAALLRAVTTDPRVAYVIWNGQIWTPARGWYKYTGPNPHKTHIHVSIKHTKAAEVGTPWALSGTPVNPTPPSWTGEMGWPVLSEGSLGDDVHELQEFLRDQGYTIDVDGRFGPGTKTALIDWQAKNGLVPDAHTGPATQGRIAAHKNADEKPLEEEEEEEETMKGATYVKNGVRYYLLFNEVSGFYSEHSGVGGAYNSTLAAPWKTGNWPEITADHARVLKENLDKVRTGVA